jgi:hypothetical protein
MKQQATSVRQLRPLSIPSKSASGISLAVAALLWSLHVQAQAATNEPPARQIETNSAAAEQSSAATNQSPIRLPDVVVTGRADSLPGIYIADNAHRRAGVHRGLPPRRTVSGAGECYRTFLEVVSSMRGAPSNQSSSIVKALALTPPATFAGIF